MKKAIDLDIKVFVAYGDSEIIVWHVRNSIHCISEHLQNFQQEAWNVISYFEAFNINSIPRFQNQETNLLANIDSKLVPSENISPNFFSIELIFRPSIPDNIVNWNIFYDDMQILNFLTNEDTFKDATIDEITHDENLHDFTVIHDHATHNLNEIVLK